ncbi:class I SAM-dependent methyltransferase [Kribbella antibiotica]|uniref:Class I SAM-dependent methyltransferase n=1 Tax=Kribbella antibiotica TaxID=190195 RepID=A0A4R4YL70_9ACTN|nr:class I SAM-dependent methyltransferase [Kribbella antibiotica]TDD45160.1 class I SAM-dependent methyltransferase [Kribbella antibiotica]
MELDWSVGEYEWFATDLAPAAKALVTAAAIDAESGHVVDLGCGTGNAALLAAELGARVTGIDPAPRLLEVATRAAAARGLEVAVLAGTAAEMPLPDGSADVVLSNFGVIMAPDPQAAADEIARVITPDGRFLSTAWQPSSFLDKLISIPAQAVAKVTGRPPTRPQPVWHDADAVAELFAPHGFKVSLTRHQLTFAVDSPDEYWNTRMLLHPIGAKTTPLLQQAGVYDAVHAEGLAYLEQLMPEFTVDYVVVEARR